jgi:hypothetical protein
MVVTISEEEMMKIDTATQNEVVEIIDGVKSQKLALIATALLAGALPVVATQMAKMAPKFAVMSHMTK